MRKFQKRKKKAMERDRFSEMYESGPVKVILARSEYPQVEPCSPKGRRAAQFRQRPPLSERLTLDALRAALPDADYPIWFQHVMYGYIVDFYFPKQDLILEINGPVHLDAERKRHDAIRARVLKDAGHRMHRVPAFLVYRPESLAKQIAQLKTRLDMSAERERERFAELKSTAMALSS